MGAEMLIEYIEHHMWGKMRLVPPIPPGYALMENIFSSSFGFAIDNHQIVAPQYSSRLQV